MIRGLYRVRGTGGLPDDVRVDDSGIEVPLAESLYRARGHSPPIDTLPWRDEYLAPKPSGDETETTREAAEKAAREQARQDFRRRFRQP